MTHWPFRDLPMFHYRCILADPPWHFATWSRKGQGKSPSAHYPTMTHKEILDLPVGDLARSGGPGFQDGCLLFLWATAPHLELAMQCLKRWGFGYVTMGAWHKRTVHMKTAFGTGYVLRSACEPFLIGRIGDPVYNDTTAARSQRNLIDARIGEHSAKPNQQYEIMEALVGGPRVELFARCSPDGRIWSRDGWDGWGLEMQSRLDAASEGQVEVEAPQKPANLPGI